MHRSSAWCGGRDEITVPCAPKANDFVLRAVQAYVAENPAPEDEAALEQYVKPLLLYIVLYKGGSKQPLYLQVRPPVSFSFAL